VASLVPTPLEIFMELANVTFSSSRRLPLGKLTSPQPAPNGLTLDAKLRANRALRIAQSMQFNDALVALVAPIASLLFSLFGQRCSLL
jgi:hypothetical protein